MDLVELIERTSIFFFITFLLLKELRVCPAKLLNQGIRRGWYYVGEARAFCNLFGEGRRIRSKKNPLPAVRRWRGTLHQRVFLPLSSASPVPGGRGGLFLRSSIKN